MDKLNVAVLFGGFSSEYGVSLQSAYGVITNMDREKFNPIMVGITAGGDWFHYTGDVAKLANDTWWGDECSAPAAISPNRSDSALLVMEQDGVKKIPIDAVFPVLHGRNGEDGTVQGACLLAGIPVVGCGVLASALCMDKDRAHILSRAAGVTVPQAFTMKKGDSIDAVMPQAGRLGYPLFVKPVKAGSSFGVCKVYGPVEFPAAVKKAFKYDDEVIVEENISGFEVGCAVMGDDKLVTGEIDEIELEKGFFDFTEKYNLVTSKIHVPARISPEKAAEVKETAKTIYRALGCQGFARVDMFLKPDGGIVFNEVNTIPGFTPHSRFPSMMKAVGVSFSEVITRAIEQAVEK